MIDRANPKISVKRQCDLIGLPRSTFYRPPAKSNKDTPRNQQLMNQIDRLYTKYPFYGSRKMQAHLCRTGIKVNRKRVQRLMRKMGIQSVAPKPNTSQRAKHHKIYPYLLRGKQITRPGQVYATDITYIPLNTGFVYLVAVIDWYSRKVLSWAISNTMDADFCICALESAIRLYGAPEIFNTDQGSQFTSEAFTGVLKDHNIKISMDGKGRALDNVFVERLWRSVKYEDIYIKHYESVLELKKGLKHYFHFYNEKRPHQGLNNCTPSEIHVVGCSLVDESCGSGRAETQGKIMDNKKQLLPTTLPCSRSFRPQGKQLKGDKFNIS